MNEAAQRLINGHIKSLQGDLEIQVKVAGEAEEHLRRMRANIADINKRIADLSEALS